MKLLLATTNRHKIREMLQILGDLDDVEFVTLDRFPGAPDVLEDGKTLRDNAILKVTHAAEHTGLLSLAEDTGLEIDALNGRPGVRSARFAGEKASYDQNVDKVLGLMKESEPDKRLARFRSVVAIQFPKEEPRLFEGICAGRIINRRKGSEGFGYDPIFIPEGHEETFAEMDAELKNKISHRAKALEKVREYLKKFNA